MIGNGARGSVFFELTPAAGGVSVTVSVFFRDLAIDDSRLNNDGEQPVLLSDFTAGDALLTVAASGAGTPYAVSVHSAVPAAWRSLLTVNAVDGEVTDDGLVTAGGNGTVVFSVTDRDGAVVFLTVRFGALSFDNDSVRINSLDENLPLLTVMADGGGVYSYALVSTNPAAVSASLSVSGNGIISDNGLATVGATMVSVWVEASEGDVFAATAVVAVEVLADVSLADNNISITLTPGDANVSVAALVAAGGDGAYTYEWVSASPASWRNSLSINSGSGEITDSGATVAGQAAGAAQAQAVFRVADGSGLFALATVHIVALDVLGVSGHNRVITVAARDNGAEVFTLTAMGGSAPYMYAVASANPSGWQNSLMINNNSGVITDNGGSADRTAAEATVVFTATDNATPAMVATVSLVVRALANMALADDDIALTLRPSDSGNVANLVASGGDGNYSYRLVSTNPMLWNNTNHSLAIDSSGNISDSGLAAGGATNVTAVFAVNDDYGFEVFATVAVVVLESLFLREDNFTLTINSADTGNLLTLSVSGGAMPYTYAANAAASNPSGWASSLAINNNGIISDSGAAANRADTATVEFTATDAAGGVVRATVEFIAVADLTVSNNSISLALDIDDAGDALATLATAGGVAPLTFAIVSSNPDETLLAINSGGVISEAGLHRIGGGGTVEFSVTDAKGMVANATLEYSYTAVKFSARSGHTAVTLNNKIYIIAGYDGTNRLNDVWSSTDGVNWSQETSSAFNAGRSEHSSAVLDSVMFVIGGNEAGSGISNDIWSSADGVNWTQQTPAGSIFSVREGSSSAVLGDTLYVIGGAQGLNNHNDIWSSGDGVNWTQQTPSGSVFPVRYEHSSAVLGDTLYIVGGAGDGAGLLGLTDVWSSENGVDWTQPTSTEARRQGHSSVVLGSNVYVIGGVGYSGGIVYLNDVRSSADGASWTEETPSAEFSARVHHASVVFGSRIYVLGGTDGTNQLGDVWSSTDGATWTQH